MIKTYMGDIYDFGLLSATFLFTLFTDKFNHLLKVSLSPTMLSDFITLLTQILVLIMVVYKFKLMKKKNKNNGDS
tara:strand:+ start:3317 stop:3541 length:225 start_codon:yes stop_codon:yes gene_type:complete